MTEVVGSVRYDIDVGYGEINQAPKVVATAEKSMVRSFNNVDAAAVKTQTQMTKVAASVKAAGSSFAGARQQLQNVGFQLQDAAVQLQLGTDKLIIAAQQLPQLLGGFGFLGAAVGALVAVGGAALTMSGAFDDAKPAAERLDDAIANLAKTAEQTEDGITVLTDQIANLAKVSQQAALAQIIIGLNEARKAAVAAGEAIGNAFDADIGLTSLQDIVKISASGDLLKISYESFNEILTETGEQLGFAGNKAAIVGREVFDLLVNAQKTGSTEALQQLQERLSQIVIESGKSNSKVLDFVGTLQDFFSKARTAGEAIKFLEGAQKDLNKALTEGTQKGRDASKSQIDKQQQLIQQLTIANVKTEEGELAATRLAAAFLLGLTNAEQLPPAIDALIKKQFEAEQRQKALNESMKQAEKELLNELGAEQQQRNKVTTEFQQVQTGVTADLESPAQKADRELSERLAVIRNYAQQEYADKEAALELQLQAEQAYSDKIKAIKQEEDQFRSQQNMSTLSAVGDFFGNLASIAEQGGKDQFSTWKALASAQAAISATMAVLNVLANPSIPYPLNIGLAASMAALAGAQVAQIQSAQYSGSGRLYGGPVGGGKLYPFMEDGQPEALQMGGKTYLWTGGGSGNVVSNKDMASGGSSGGVNISVVVENYGNEKVSVSRDQNKGVTGEEVIKIIVGNINERGQVHSAIMRSTTAGNRT